ncbi:MAG: glycosyltransferase [Lachnospiraceae bacterium]|nr:glycosyltransferase [Lachnospiraceae bacterium]
MADGAPSKLLTAVIPVYKVELTYLDECFKSILAQTFKDFELIIVNDGAPGDVTEFIDSYDFRGADVRIIKQENQGVSVARNAGIDAAKGKYLTFVDADDTIDPDKFRGIVSFASENDLEVLMWAVNWNYPDHTYKFSPYTCDIPKFTDEMLEEVQLKCMVGILPFYKCPPAGKDASGSAGAKLYNVDFLRRNNLRYTPGLAKSEDMLFNLKVFDVAKSVGFLQRFYYEYRLLDSSATFCYRENGIDVMTPVLEGIREHLQKSGKSELFFQVYYMRCMFFYLESMDMDYLNPNNPKPLRVRLKELAQKSHDEPYAAAFKNLSGEYLTFARKIPLFLIRHGMFRMLAMFYKVYTTVLK